ncbi:Fic family protein [archaeon]|jgi:Fic family protein|nr:Fic family protein [archaeon]MBT4373519.1 Fic family protein [archaeon]MBT4531967.1 Fic family protein [archaeon]MBT7001634.1 Fic family protein [archaeon]MBT7282474.1 Fic family protein [archaeon]
MVYTEIKEKGGRKYFYRVKSIRRGKDVNKKRIYLGVDLDKRKLSKKEADADKELSLLSTLLTKSEETELKKIKEIYLKQLKATEENRYEAFVSLFTYDSTSIEGNTLTLQETSQLLFERVTPRKSLREINEIMNHKKAFDYLLNCEGDLNKKMILNLHKLVVKETLKEELENQIGKYRTLQVYIRGTEWMPPKPTEVAKEMSYLLSWYTKNKNKLHPLILATYFHSAFETIHPFVDGNGRVGRLLMNFVLRKNKYPMINIPSKNKYRYYEGLEESQVNGNLRPLIKFLFDLLRDEKIIF